MQIFQDYNVNQMEKKRVVDILNFTYLGNAGGTEPIAFWHLHDLRPQAEHVTPTITAITQEQVLVIITLTAHLTRLWTHMNISVYKTHSTRFT